MEQLTALCISVLMYIKWAVRYEEIGAGVREWEGVRAAFRFVRRNKKDVRGRDEGKYNATIGSTVTRE